MAFGLFNVKAGNYAYWQELVVRAKDRQSATHAFRAYLAAEANWTHEEELFAWEIENVKDQNAELLEEDERPPLVAEREKWNYTFLDDDITVYENPDRFSEDSFPLGHAVMIDSGGNG